MSDLLQSSKALLDLDAENALVPHGLGGHGRKCLEWCVMEIERLRLENEEVRACFNAASYGMDHKTVFKLITDAKAYVAQTRSTD